MISLRRHVLTLVAVFLALAVGVVLGSTSVATSVRDAVVDREETTAGRLESAEQDLSRKRLESERLNSMVGDLTPAVADGRLSGRPVLVVVAPGASQRRRVPGVGAGGIMQVVSDHRTLSLGGLELRHRAACPSAPPRTELTSD